jgi:hypothetical protein
MTWTVNINGHDDLSGDEKEALERVIVGESMALVESLKAQNGNNITSASVVTNTTGSVDLLNPDNQI